MGNGIWVWGRQPSQKHSGTPVLLLPQKPTCHPSCSVFLVLSSFSPRPAPRPPGVHQESTKAILVSRHPVPAWGYSSSLSLLVPWLPQKPAPGALSGGREEGAWAPGSPSTHTLTPSPFLGRDDWS